MKNNIERPPSSRFSFLLFLHTFFIHSVFAYNQNLCTGHNYNVHHGQPGNQGKPYNSLGSGANDAFNNRLSQAIYAGKNAKCWRRDPVANNWTVHYIKYPSTDIEDPGGNILFGWLHIRINVPAGIEWINLQPFVPKPEVTYVPGEIVMTRFPTTCKEKFEGMGVEEIQKKYLAPCFFAPDPSPIVPVALIRYSSTRINTLWFNYHTDFPECAMLHETESLEFRMYGNRDDGVTTDSCTKVDGSPVPNMVTVDQKQLHFKNSTYGVYDPEPPRLSTNVLCTEMTDADKPLWVHSHSGSIWQNHDGYPAYIDSKCNAKAYGSGQSFAGRCGKEPNQPYESNQNTKYHCEGERGQRVKDVAYVPEFSLGASNYGGCKEARNNTKEKGISANSHIGQIIWGLRTTHGLSMAVTTMLVAPTGLILSRHYKETWMNQRYVNVHLWHGIHISTSLTTLAGLLAGIVSGIFGRMYFGFGRNSVSYTHATLGYLSFFLFLGTILSSPFRDFTKSTRLTVIFLHFLVGNVTRVLWLLCLLTSFYIPGSPSATSDYHTEGFQFQLYSLIVVIWFMVDLAVHVFLTLNMMRTDKALKFPKRRTYAIAVPIPLIRPYAEKEEEAPGEGLRKLLFILYVVVCFLCAVALASLICFSTTEGRWFGPMRYTHKDSGKLNMLLKDSLYIED